MSFDFRAHAFIPDDTPDEPLPWLSALDWYLTHGYTDPDPADPAIWTLTGRDTTEPGHSYAVEHRGRLAAVDLAKLAADWPAVRLWHVTGRARAPYCDQALPTSVMGKAYTVREILHAALRAGRDAEQLRHVAKTVSELLADGSPWDCDNDVDAMVMETMMRLDNK